MDHHGIIDAEADIDQRLGRAAPPHTQHGPHRAQQAVLVAGGAPNPPHNLEDEQTPLLSRNDSNASDHVGPGNQESKDNDAGEEWPGRKDLEALPWWKRPSVCADEGLPSRWHRS